MTELKNLDFNQKYFVANGNEYVIESEISIDRAVWKHIFLLEMEKGIEAGKQTEDWNKLYTMCFEDKSNEEKLRSVATMAYNNMTGFQKLFENRPPILKICALFINRTNEDRRFINMVMIDEKISDWINEGIAYGSFFLLATGLAKIEVERFGKPTKDILEQMENFLQNIEKLMDTPISS